MIGGYYVPSGFISTPEGPKSIADAIRVSHSLTECNLRENELHKEGWCAIFDALRDNPQSKIATWNLRDQGINAIIAKSLAAYVAVSGSLTQLNVEDNELGAEGEAAIRKAVEGREGFVLDIDDVSDAESDAESDDF